MEMPTASPADKEHFRSVLPVPFGPTERPMGGDTGLPEIRNGEGDADEARAKAWVEKAFEQVAALPPKAPKAATAQTAKK